VGLGSFNLPMTGAGERASRVIMILYWFCRRSTVRRSLCDNHLRDIWSVYDDATSCMISYRSGGGYGRECVLCGRGIKSLLSLFSTVSTVPYEERIRHRPGAALPPAFG